MAWTDIHDMVSGKKPGNETACRDDRSKPCGFAKKGEHFPKQPFQRKREKEGGRREVGRGKWLPLVGSSGNSVKLEQVLRRG